MKFRSVLLRRKRNESEVAFIRRVDKACASMSTEIFDIRYPDMYHAIIITAKCKNR